MKLVLCVQCFVV